MNNTHFIHVPFRNLPAEARFLFFLLATGAMALHRDWPPTPAEISDDLEAAWNTEKLTEADFDVPGRIEKVLEKYLAKYASDEGRWWVEYGQQPIRRCRKRDRS